MPSGPISDDTVFRALADPTRRMLLDRVHAHGGQTLQQLCEGLGIARQSVSKHIGILETAGLVWTVREGRTRLHYLNSAPIDEVIGRWLDNYDRHRAETLGDLKQSLERRSMSNDQKFVYVTYVRATADEVWRGLTEPAFTLQYWGVALESDWHVGSLLTWTEGGARISDPEQRVLEADRPRRLAYTWHTFSEDWARTHDFAEELRLKLASEPRSHVIFEIDDVEGGMVKLTLTHDFRGATSIAPMCSQAWPRLLSDLKTILESV